MTEKTERFVPLAKVALNMAQVLVEDRDERLIEPHHLLFGLIHARNSIASTVLTEFGITQDNLLDALDKYPTPKPDPKTNIILSERLKDILAAAVKEAKRLRLQIIGTGQLLIGVISKRTPPVRDLLKQLNINPEALIDRTRQIIILEQQRSNKTSYKLHDDNWWYQFSSELFRFIGVEPLPPKSSSYNYDDQADVDQLELINWSLQMYPNSPHLFYRKGGLYLEKKIYDAAIQSFSDAIRLKPDFTSAYYNRGHVYIAVAQYENAIVDLNEALRLNPNAIGARLSRGIANFDLGKYDAVLDDINAMIQRDDKNAAAYALRAWVSLNQTNYDHALDDCTKALKLNPNSIIAYQCQGKIHAEQQDYERAEADFQAALKLAPEESTSYSNLAWLKLLIGDYEDANHYANEALHINPYNDVAYYCRGRISAIKGDHEMAVADYRQSLKLWLNIHSKRTEHYYEEMRDYIAQRGKPDDSSAE